MRKIPEKLRKEMEEDPYYRVCCITKSSAGKIDWHHNFIYAGRQVNEKWCILPLNSAIHRNIEKYKEQCDWIMLNRADEKTLEKYSKAISLLKLRERLNKKYGKE